MSHAATKWAFDQPELHKDMKPSEWAVLMVLADCHNPVNGCFPSQEYIRTKTNLSERAVRDQLTRLRDRKLINWDESREGGRRGSNRYSLGFEPDFQPADIAASSTGEIEHIQPAEFDENNRQNLPPNLVIEPVREPTPQPRVAQGGGFSILWNGWGSALPDNREYAERQFGKLTDVEQAYAIDRAPEYIALMAKRNKPAQMVPYLKERRFLVLIDAPETDRDGDFVITPGREEWGPWMGAMRKQFGPAGVESFVKIGKIITKTRWPEGHPNGQAF